MHIDTWREVYHYYCSRRQTCERNCAFKDRRTANRLYRSPSQQLDERPRRTAPPIPSREAKLKHSYNVVAKSGSRSSGRSHPFRLFARSVHQHCKCHFARLLRWPLGWLFSRLLGWLFGMFPGRLPGRHHGRLPKVLPGRLPGRLRWRLRGKLLGKLLGRLLGRLLERLLERLLSVCMTNSSRPACLGSPINGTQKYPLRAYDHLNTFSFLLFVTRCRGPHGYHPGHNWQQNKRMKRNMLDENIGRDASSSCITRYDDRPTTVQPLQKRNDCDAYRE